ncbi:KIAA1324L [Branchiostoma lanceolatum]|uniref:KIAA1324L protein n=2 Tax=Branchiostoma lanceolatum TaxID=7740 RepID=A0A8K0EQ68_BRALA|nr:KIAA1324L [Branchiostoma lanceolatum]
MSPCQVVVLVAVVLSAGPAVLGQGGTGTQVPPDPQPPQPTQPPAGDTCSATDFHYEYTECDSSGGRWRVLVPNVGNTCTGPPPADTPRRGKECSFSCGSGEFFNIDQQACQRCPPGSYSLGGGVLFDHWEALPGGFTTTAEIGDYSYSSQTNCSEVTWEPKGDFIASGSGDCTTTLVYAANLKKAGKVTFTYQYIDDNTIFHVYVQNEQCQTVMDSDTNKWPDTTEEGKWKEESIDLTSGNNVIYWKTTGLSFGNERKPKPVFIKKITIEGVAYTSECTKCPPGTYTDQPGQSECKACEENHHQPQPGQRNCQKCPKNHFAEAGSSQCTPMPPCKTQDYFETHTPCDEDKKTQLMYKWIEPKICRDDVNGAVQLPASGAKEPCPPCNPGMAFPNETATVCDFCPANQYSAGEQLCQNCPPSTEPNYSHQYKWWNSLPSSMEMTCISVHVRGCASTRGWELASDHIHSGVGNADDAYLVLALRTEGYRDQIPGSPGEFGRITFVFDTVCTSGCQLFFMQEIEGRGTKVIESWSGAQSKQQYSFVISAQDAMTFTWAFQKTDEVFGDNQQNFPGDLARIYMINVTNTVDGGASSCTACPQGSKNARCIPCEKGFFANPDTNKCEQCPRGTYLNFGAADGPCVPCSEGTTSNEDRTACYSDCTFTDEEGHKFDLSALKGFHTVHSAPTFTAMGTRYFYQFNVSLCGNNGIGEASCLDNITAVEGQGSRPGEVGDVVKGMVCRSTIIPTNNKGIAQVISAQPDSLGDRLLNVTLAGVNNTGTAMSEMVDLFEPEQDGIHDLMFEFQSEKSTMACPEGRRTLIYLRCDYTQTGEGKIELPRNCPTGTCTGCDFHFLWHTQQACPLCTESDFTSIEGQCKDGQEVTQYLWTQTEYRTCRDGVALPATKTKKCHVLSIRDPMVQIGVGLATCCSILLVCMLAYFWRKNRKLEYKYMRLMQNSTKLGELPKVESCMDDGEDEDEVIFNEGGNSASTLFNKFKNKMQSKMAGEGDNPFESIQLTPKQQLSNI